jgi:hypothetical protein
MRTVIFACVITLFSFLPGTKNDCIKITCLNPADTIRGLTERRTFYLLESTDDTISNFDIRSSCGCEYPILKKDCRVYPGHPDTVIIVSSLKGHLGHWKKETTITAATWTKTFFTGPWIIYE